MTLAPIVLFVYNRPTVTLQTLQALQNNLLAEQSILYVFSDGPKPGATEAEKKKIDEVKSIVKNTQWCKEVHLIESESNKGLANSIINGVTDIVKNHGRIIVMEDDIITSKFFLKYLNDGLDTFEKAQNVYAVNSYMFPIKAEEATTFLCPLATSTWGWATWAEKWKAFEEVPTFKTVIQQNPFLRARFNFADYNYADMLDNSNSWGIRWYYSVFMRNGLGVFPTKSLSRNIGFGDEATHTGWEFPQMNIFNGEIEVKYDEVINIEYYEKLMNYFTKEVAEKTFYQRTVELVKRVRNL